MDSNQLGAAVLREMREMKNLMREFVEFAGAGTPTRSNGDQNGHVAGAAQLEIQTLTGAAAVAFASKAADMTGKPLPAGIIWSPKQGAGGCWVISVNGGRVTVPFVEFGIEGRSLAETLHRIMAGDTSASLMRKLPATLLVRLNKWTRNHGRGRDD